MTGSHWTRVQDAIEHLTQKDDIKINDIYAVINKIKKNNYNNNNINYTNINKYINNINIYNDGLGIESQIESSFVKIICMLVKKTKTLETELQQLERKYNDLICCQPAHMISSTRCEVARIDETLSKCCICMDNEKEYAYVNCGHMCVCIDCQKGEWKNKCPLCKTPGACIKIFK